MRKSIKKMVGYRVAAALLSVVLFSVVTTVNIMRIKRAEDAQAFALLNRAQTAEAAHYKWSSGLSSALYAGKEFTGSIDPTTCVLGKWLYGEAGTDNARILSLLNNNKKSLYNGGFCHSVGVQVFLSIACRVSWVVVGWLNAAYILC